MGERDIRIVEARGSNPLISTIPFSAFQGDILSCGIRFAFVVSLLSNIKMFFLFFSKKYYRADIQKMYVGRKKTACA